MSRLVIDASVALRAGGRESVKPACRSCRDFLREVLDNNHQITWTEEISIEWRNRAAGFARRWLVQMFGRKKVARVENAEVLGLTATVVDALTTEPHKAAAAKDCHLLHAALHSDKAITSLDEKARRIFARACSKAAAIREIIWVNPNVDAEAPLYWLRNGAPADQDRMLTQVLDE